MISRLSLLVIAGLLNFVLFLTSSCFANSKEIVIDTVLASVEGIPITLRELEAQYAVLYPSKPALAVSAEQISSNPELKKVLESLINQRLIDAESEKRKIKVSVNDVERYIDQVAKQNNLSRPEFELALKQQGQNIDGFALLAKTEVQKAKIMGQIAQSAPAVTDEELQPSEEEGEEIAEKKEEGLRYKLREIVILSADPDSSEIKQQQVSKGLAEGVSFADLAVQYSDGATAKDGGDLGFIAEEDLSEDLKESVSDLKVGEVSKALKSSDSVRFYFLESKLEEGEQAESGSARKEALRKELESRKLNKRFEQFFTEELPKLHKVERKF